MSHLKWVTIPKFFDLSGYTEDAVRSKIKRGDWLEGLIWKKAPDGRILIDTEEYAWWVENGAEASAQLLRQASKSTSTTAGSAAASA